MRMKRESGKLNWQGQDAARTLLSTERKVSREKPTRLLGQWLGCQGQLLRGLPVHNYVIHVHIIKADVNREKA